MNLNIFMEATSDYLAVESLIQKAFENAPHTDRNEHNLVKKLRESNEFIKELSLIAKHRNKIVAHVLLTKAQIQNNNKSTLTLALAPVSVLPEYQNKGIGTKLLNYALNEAKSLGFNSVIVLGYPTYYSKFGFKTASFFNINAPFEIPDECFMALELTQNSLNTVSGTVIYSKAFF